MIVKELELENFRIYSNLKLKFSPKINLFLGSNGQGKTNIVEALIYTSTLQSHRTSSDQPLINNQATKAIIKTQIEKLNRNTEVRLELDSTGPNKAIINNQVTRKKSEILGNLYCVYFAPEDLDLVRKEPGERRKFIDQFIVQLHPRFASIFSNYDKLLRQRNAALKNQFNSEVVNSFTDSLIELGAEITATRINTLNKLLPYFQDSYKNISTSKIANFRYESKISGLTADKNENFNLISNYAKERARDEQVRGVTLFGPHRDNIVLELGDMPVIGYASHGESWSIALSLKIATFDYFKSENFDPILILDDVFAELDQSRRQQLTSLIEKANQVFITTAVEADIPSNLNFTQFTVVNGVVELVSELIDE